MKNSRNRKHIEERLKWARDRRAALINKKEETERKISDIECVISDLRAA